MTLWTREGGYSTTTFQEIKELTEARLSRSVPLLTPDVYREYEIHQTLRITGEGNPSLFRTALYRNDREAFDMFFFVAGEKEEIRYKKFCLVGRDVTISTRPVPETSYVREREKELLPILCREVIEKIADRESSSYQLVVSDLKSGRSWQRSVSSVELYGWRKELPVLAKQFRSAVYEEYSPLSLAGATVPVVERSVSVQRNLHTGPVVER